MELSKIIDKVIAVIPTREHWIQEARHAGGMWGEQSHCVLGAIDVVQKRGDIAKGQRSKLTNLLRTCLPKGHYGSIVHFNDDDSTTYQDIRAFLDRAKEKAEATEMWTELRHFRKPKLPKKEKVTDKVTV